MSIKITSLEELKDKVSHNPNVAILCYAKFCPSSILMGPVFGTTASTKAPKFEGVLFAKVDLKEQPEIGENYKILKYPSVVFFHQGREIVRLNGSRKQEEFEEKLADALGSAKGGEVALTLTVDGPVCTGIYEDRKGAPALFSDKKKPFNDLEPNCVIKSTAAVHETQIGRANEGKSHFVVTLWNSPVESPGKIFFRLDFITDPSEKGRFKSAMFQVTFGYEDPTKKHLPINITELFPMNAQQRESRTFFDVDAPTDSENEHYNLSTSSDDSPSNANSFGLGLISGQGAHSPTATWNFVEAPKEGLADNYVVSVTLPTTSKVCMKFYGKAVHVRSKLALGRSRVIIQVGSLEKPYERILDPSEDLGHSGSGEEVQWDD